MSTERSRQKGKHRLIRATTVTLSATLSLAVSHIIATKIASAATPAERIAVIRAAVSEGKITRADGSPLNPAQVRTILAESPPWGDYGWNKRFDDGRV